MNFNIVSKNNLGAVGALILAILLSQSRIFNFLIDTVLGRFALIIMLILISYANKILGIVSVFLIVILFNTSDIGYLEGFDGKDNERKNNNDRNNNRRMDENNKDENDKNMKKKIYVSTNAKETESTTVENDVPAEETTTSEATTTSEETVATEGFNILGMENEIKRGKNSNSIPVSNMMNNSDNALPFDPESVKENFSAF